jgi:hypothetical protein
MRRLVFAAVAAVMTLGVLPTAAHADAPRDKGWWTVTNPGGLPAAPPAPPDVPADGLLIQGGGGGAPTAYAALLYELPQGSTAGNLTLTIAPNSATTPSTTLQVCPLLQPINHPEAGGPIADAPPFNCAHAVTAAPGADAKGYQFQAAGLVADGLVAVAILPTGPVDRVVLSAPDAGSLTTQESIDSSSSGTDNSANPSDAAPAPLSDATSGLQNTGASPSLADSLPGASAAGPSSVSPAPAATPNAQTGVGGAFVPAVSAGPEKATPLLVILFVAAGLGGAVLWLYAGRQRADAALSG